MLIFIAVLLFLYALVEFASFTRNRETWVRVFALILTGLSIWSGVYLLAL